MHFYITWEISEQFSCREFSLFSYIILENTRISASEIYNLQLNFGLYLAVNWKNNTDVTIFRRDVIVKLFWRCFVSLVKFSYWSKFHINIITGSGVMTIFFYKGVTRHSEIRNTPVWVFSEATLSHFLFTKRVCYFLSKPFLLLSLLLLSFKQIRFAI